MKVNLFVKIPTDHPGSNPPEYFGGVVASVSWEIPHGGGGRITPVYVALLYRAGIAATARALYLRPCPPSPSTIS